MRTFTESNILQLALGVFLLFIVLMVYAGAEKDSVESEKEYVSNTVLSSNYNN